MLLLMMQGLLKVNYPDVNLVIRLLNLYTLMKLNIVKVDLSNILNKKEEMVHNSKRFVPMTDIRSALC